MQCKSFAGTGVELPKIGQGTWDVPERGARSDDWRRALRRGIELGMTHIDTAEMYGSGTVEELLGEALQGVARESIFLTSKVLPGNASFDGTIRACERSLRRLRVDYLDCYLLHWPSSVPLEETMNALATLVREGKTRFVGVSNFDADDMLEARALLGAIPMSCNQVLYHLHERGIEHRIVPAARESEIAIVAYTPFGRGRFAKTGDALERIARKHHASVRQITLAFLTREPNVFTIPKASQTAHVEENAGAGDIVLDADDIAEIDAAFPLGRERPLATL
ncbi:MAG: aldo/keto reductase [Candidatus Eremiobacteraeota bacterium]|nr:aldo/keto reductase [Candidatus Eremiobacteraeota bacterium]